MLDAYIIDSIRREEEERERAFERRRIHLELPIERERPRPEQPRGHDEPFMGDPVVIPFITPDEIDDAA